MTANRKSKRMHFGYAIVLASAALGSAQGAVTGTYIANNVPKFTAMAKNVGATNPTTIIEVSVWLNPHNRAGLDALAEELYAPSSSKYRQWLKPAEFAEQFAPTAAEAETVEKFLSSNGLSVVQVGPKNMYVRARGTVAAINKTFAVKLNNFELNGKTYYANTTAPYVTGAAGSLTAAVGGLHNLQYTHPNATRQIAKKSSGPGFNSAASSSGPVPAVTAPFSNPTCFTGAVTESFSNGGTYPYATYKGNEYTNNPVGCGYTPPEIHTAYNLSALYKEGFDGTGQTIVIIDWCGSPTIKSDANAFSAAYGLPPLTSSNFSIINSSTTPTCGGPDPEINIDVEWAHAIAPGANIALVVPPSASFPDVDEAELFAVLNPEYLGQGALYGGPIGNVISGSYGSEEYYDGTEVLVESLINEIAAVEGVAANFSTGDEGDFTFDYPEYNPPSVSAPADSPYATGVGGVSLVLTKTNTIAWQTGWGTNVNPLDGGGYIYDPPLGFFEYGSGGGASAVFTKPFFQSKLKGNTRQLPDISWLGDPFTGGVIVISEPFQYPEQIYTVYGGTSLACPMFSALWAIANQEAGVALGQAAPYLYYMPSSTITDVLAAPSSSTNVTATIKEPGGITNFYNAAAIAAPLELTTSFYSALWNYPLAEDTVYALTFGTDSGLVTTKGWDNVTGLGTPNGKAFADFFNPGK